MAMIELMKYLDNKYRGLPLNENIISSIQSEVQSLLTLTNNIYHYSKIEINNGNLVVQILPEFSLDAELDVEDLCKKLNKEISRKKNCVTKFSHIADVGDSISVLVHGMRFSGQVVKVTYNKFLISEYGIQYTIEGTFENESIPYQLLFDEHEISIVGKSD